MGWAPPSVDELRDGRLTAEVERMASSSSAPSGFRSLGGNESEITVGFVVGTVAPEVSIDSPQPDTFVPAGEPVIVLLFSDDRSGVDRALVQLKIDGVERPAGLTPTPAGATLALSPTMRLVDGPHRIEARMVDRAGNATDATCERK